MVPFILIGGLVLVGLAAFLSRHVGHRGRRGPWHDTSGGYIPHGSFDSGHHHHDANCGHHHHHGHHHDAHCGHDAGGDSGGDAGGGDSGGSSGD